MSQVEITFNKNEDGTLPWQDKIGALNKGHWLIDGKWPSDKVKKDFYEYMIACKTVKIDEFTKKVNGLTEEVKAYQDKIDELDGVVDPVKLALAKVERAKKAVQKAKAEAEALGVSIS